MVGFIKPSYMSDGSGMNGVTLSTYANGDYISIGHSSSVDENSWNSNPNIFLAKHGNFGGVIKQGINFINANSYFHNLATFFRGLHTTSNMAIHFGDLLDRNMVYATKDSSQLLLYGNDSISLGIMDGENRRTGIQVVEDSSLSAKCRINTWGHWDCHGWTINNVNISRTLTAQSRVLRSRTKDINDIYGSMTLTKDEIRFVNREPIKMHTDRTIMIEIPQIMSENMENKYHVSIGKIGLGDYRIVEKTPYYFILETNMDNFEFTYEIVGKQLFDTDKNISVASLMYYENVKSEKSRRVEEEKDEIFSFIESDK